ncbi:MAG: carboxypeptidase-like regulatory domain-containing protein [Chloroflexales bacterium]|nr:carboxypeptidase-like regulatory domain-containing protein [Chloroflexales bacterium]
MYETQWLTAIAIFDLEDRYARLRQGGESHPRPIGPVAMYLVGRMIDGQRQDFAQPLELRVRRNPSGYYLFFGEVKQRDSTLRRVDLAPGAYIIRVESQYYQVAERTDIVLPRYDAAYFFDLAPGFAYPFPAQVWKSHGPTLLRGNLYHRDGAGLAGALIEVAGQEQQGINYRTDATGQWVLVFPYDQPSTDIKVRFTLPDGTTKEVNAHIVHGRDTSLFQTALRGWVLNEAGVGVRGATIRVEGRPGQTTTGSDGGWFYYFDLDQPAAQVRVTATLTDGRSRTQGNVPVQPGATTVAPTFRFL